MFGTVDTLLQYFKNMAQIATNQGGSIIINPEMKIKRKLSTSISFMGNKFSIKPQVIDDLDSTCQKKGDAYQR